MRRAIEASPSVRRRYALHGGLMRAVGYTRRVPAIGNLGRWLLFPFGERMRMIRLKLQNGDELDLPGTLFRRGNVRRIVQPIKHAMGITHPTRP